MLNTALAREHWIDLAEINIEAVVAGRGGIPLKDRLKRGIPLKEN